MELVNSQQLLALWELGIKQAPLQRALLMLQTLKPEMSLEALAQLSLGKRNQQLLQMREQLFGQTMLCLLPCKQCTQTLEFTLNTQQLVLNTESIKLLDNQTRKIKLDDFEFDYRLLTSQDLAITLKKLSIDNTVSIEQLLLTSCILLIKQDEQIINIEQLPKAVLTAFIAELEQSDPLAEIKIDLTCPSCQASWQGLFDIASFLWEELVSYAQRLLAEVHQLALAYSWSEQTILALSTERRRYYLERVKVQ